MPDCQRGAVVTSIATTEGSSSTCPVQVQTRVLAVPNYGDVSTGKTSDPFRFFMSAIPVAPRHALPAPQIERCFGWLGGGHFSYTPGKKMFISRSADFSSQIHEPGSRLPQDRNLRELCLALRLLGWCCPLGFGLSCIIACVIWPLDDHQHCR